MTLFHHLGIVASSGLAKGAPGMVLLTPTSITHSGTSASVGANGQVTFSAVTSLSLNGVFSADFDNYVVSLRGTANSGTSLDMRLRATGSDASGSNYTRQTLIADGATVSSSRGTSLSAAVISGMWTTENGHTISIYGPFLTQPTAYRSVTLYAENSATLRDNAGTHSLSTSYDGFTLIMPVNNITGALQVYGVRS